MALSSGFRRRSALLAVAIGIVGTVLFWQRQPARDAAGTTPAEPDRVALAYPDEHVAAVSPDGSFVVYVGRLDTAPQPHALLIVRRAGGPSAALFAPRPDIDPRSPFVSPDGGWVGFFDRGRIVKVPSNGGSPTRICDCGADPHGGGAWLDDGSIVFRAGDRLRVVAGDGGARRDLTRVPPGSGERAHTGPARLPRKDLLLFTVLSDDPRTSSLALVNLKTGRHQPIRQGGRFGRWVEPGLLVFQDPEGRLRAVSIDRETYTPFGDDTLLEAGSVWSSGEGVGFDLAPDGTLAYLPGDAVVGGRSLWWVTRDGVERRAPLAPHGYTYPRISPDGSIVALDVRMDTFNVWLWRLRGDSVEQLTQGRRNGYPAWLPDSRSLLVSSDRDGKDAVYRLSLAEPNRWLTVARGERPLLPYAVSADGRAAVLRETRERGAELAVTSIDDPRTLERMGMPDDYALNAAFSPDGRWLAYQAGDAARSDIYVQRFPGAAASRVRVSPQGGLKPLWARSHSGLELVFLDPAYELMGAPVAIAGDALKVSRPTRVFPSDYSSRSWFHGPNGRTFDVTPDGDRFLVIKEEEKEPQQERTLRIRRAVTTGVPSPPLGVRVSAWLNRVSRANLGP